MLIAIDAMGGDNAPECNVEGALSAAAEWSDTQIVLVGDEARLEPLLKNKPSNVMVRHAGEVIGSDEEAGQSSPPQEGFIHGCGWTHGA